MNRRITAIMRKEVWHILRDWQTLLIVLAMPVFMMFLYGYALDVNIRDVPVMVIDPENSPESRALITAIEESDLFKVTEVKTSSMEPEELFRQNRIKAVFRFPTHFSNDLRRTGGTTIQVLIDGSDQNLGTVLRNAVEPFLQKATFSLVGRSLGTSLTVNQIILYNPEQRTANFFVPGLMAIILMMVSAMLTSLTIVREKEMGTLEQLLVSPLGAREILLGKIAPYILIAAIDGILVLLVGRFLFGVHVQGSLALLSLASLFYIFVALALGMLVSTVARQQEHAMFIVMPATMLPTVLLSGFIFPLSSLPFWLQIVSSIIPATYYLEIIRGIILKGAGIAILWKPMLILAAMGVFLMGLSIRKFRVHT